MKQAKTEAGENKSKQKQKQARIKEGIKTKKKAAKPPSCFQII
jgi:hypothetical protein